MTSQISTASISDDFMQDRMSKAKILSLVVLKPSDERSKSDASAIVWEHGRRNLALQAAGIMPIVCPVGSAEVAGIAFFDTEPSEARILMEDDPGVRAGIFTYEVHSCLVFLKDET